MTNKNLEHIQQRAEKLLLQKLEYLCDFLEQGTHMDTGKILHTVQSISVSLTALRDIQSDRLSNIQLKLPQGAQPTHVYHCHERCVSYDGKRCGLLGHLAPCYTSGHPCVCTPWLDAVVEALGVADEAVWGD